MTRIGVDFNRLTHDGLVKGNTRRADGPMAEGAIVEAYDLDDPTMSYEAEVAAIEGSSVLLRPHWAEAPTPSASLAEWLRAAWISRSSIRQEVRTAEPSGQVLRCWEPTVQVRPSEGHVLVK